LRVVLDTRLRTPLGAKLVASAMRVPTLIFHAQSTERAVVGRVAKLRASGVQLAAVRRARGGRGLDIESVLRELARRGVVRLLVEGGAHVHAALLDAGLADRAAIFVAPRILADTQAVPMVASAKARSLQSAFVLAQLERRWCGQDVLFQGALQLADARPESRRQTRHTRRSSSTTGPREPTKV
jgi:diaminohydroxyphosphoribosylaminopyrimidine deaminase/5-amino-6-(5-phosphoribosylamino)uracil reductase